MQGRQPQQQLPQAPLGNNDKVFPNLPDKYKPGGEADNGWPVGVDPNDYLKKSEYQADKQLMNSKLDAILRSLGDQGKEALKANAEFDKQLNELASKIETETGKLPTKAEVNQLIESGVKSAETQIQAQIDSGKSREEAEAIFIREQFSNLRKANEGNEEKIKQLDKDEAELLSKAGEMSLRDIIIAILGAGGLTGAAAALFRQNSAEQRASDKAEEVAKSKADTRVDEVKKEIREESEKRFSRVEDLLERGLKRIGDDNQNLIPDVLEELAAGRSPLAARALDIIGQRIRDQHFPNYGQQPQPTQPQTVPPQQPPQPQAFDPSFIAAIVKAVKEQ